MIYVVVTCLHFNICTITPLLHVASALRMTVPLSMGATYELVSLSAPLRSASPAPALIYIPTLGLLHLSPAAPCRLPEVTPGSVGAAG